MASGGTVRLETGQRGNNTREGNSTWGENYSEGGRGKSKIRKRKRCGGEGIQGTDIGRRGGKGKQGGATIGLFRWATRGGAKIGLNVPNKQSRTKKRKGEELRSSTKAGFSTQRHATFAAAR